VDPVRLEILWERLRLVTEEAAWAIKTTSFSSVVTEAFDFGCLLFDIEGRMIAQNSDIAGKIGCWHTIIPEIQRLFGDDIAPGDVFLTNDPWTSEGHLYDCSVVKPVFYNDRLIAFADCTAHVSDIGGSVSNAGRDVYEEGLFIPVVRAVQAGREDAQVFRWLAANFRRPEQSLGDIRGLIAGVTTCDARLVQFMAANDLADLNDLSEQILTRTESALRSAISERIPEGDYFYSITSDGYSEPVTIAATIRREGDGLVVDFTGTSPEQPMGINSVFNVTYAWVTYAVKAALSPSLPNNHGSFAPIEVRAPEGTIVNPTRGAPVRMKASTSHLVSSVVLGALCKTGRLPAIAEAGSPVWLLRFSGITSAGVKFADTMMINGGVGAIDGKDGLAAVAFPSNAAGTPIEVIEESLPIRVLRRALIPDSGGDGKYRGGLGQEFTFEVLPQQLLRILIQAERINHAPRGVDGGHDGSTGKVLIDGREVSAKSQFVLEAGSVVQLLLPGGGGLGDPSERPTELAEADYWNAFPEEVVAGPTGGAASASV
jgi:N-methylhydantoinase B